MSLILSERNFLHVHIVTKITRQGKIIVLQKHSQFYLKLDLARNEMPTNRIRSKRRSIDFRIFSRLGYFCGIRNTGKNQRRFESARFEERSPLAQFAFSSARRKGTPASPMILCASCSTWPISTIGIFKFICLIKTFTYSEMIE